MRAVVTGCAGFIGSHLTERLIGDGWHVTGVDAFTPYYDPAEKEANLAALTTEPRFDLVWADLTSAGLGGLLADHPVVFHLAAQPGVRGSFGESFEQYVRANVLSTQRLFEAALAARCHRVVYASSSSVYGAAPSYPCREDTVCAPRSPYGVTKRTCELLADLYAGLGLEAVGLRFFTVYGPRQRPDMAIRLLCEAACGGPPFHLHGDGTQSRDFTHVVDAVDATVRAGQLLSPGAGALFNVGGGHEASMIEVIALLEGMVGGPISVDRGPFQRGDVLRTGADTLRARACLGWQPQVELADGLRSELEWVRRRHRDVTPAGAGAAWSA